MSVFQQLIQYLSQPPDSIVYHIVTLLALQATLGLAWWQARHDPDDAFARRLAWASGAILLSRLIVLLALFATAGLVEAVALLPPLERAVDTLTAALLVWALAPHPKNLPHLGNALLVVVVIVIAFVFSSFALEWRADINSGVVAEGYSGSQQADVWDILQMSILTVGGLLVLFARESQWTLRLAILAALFVAHLLSLLFGGTLGPPNINVSFWTRFGNIVAFPMLAVLAYRHNLHRLLPASRLGPAAVEQVVSTLSLSGKVASSLEMEQTLNDAFNLVYSLTAARFVAIALASSDRSERLELWVRAADDADARSNQTRTPTRTLRRSDWPAFASALRQDQQMELLPDGPGARQLHELRRELGMSELGPVLIEPLKADQNEVGLMLLSGGVNANTWTENEKALSRALGSFVSRAVASAQRYQLSLAGLSPDLERAKADLVADLQGMAEERDEALNREARLDQELNVALCQLDIERRKVRETTQALAFTAQRQAKLQRLEEEVTTLREALSEAELALANAAAGDAGLSTEWVMHTVTRYSGELEEAQATIDALESELKIYDSGLLLEIASSMRKLRTPLTSLAGYADLMLEGNAGAISPEQESLIRRMRANVANMTHTVDLVTSTAYLWQSSQAAVGAVDVREVIETAIRDISPSLRAKTLRLRLDVAENLPPLPKSHDTFYQLVVGALTAASLATPIDSSIEIIAVQEVHQVPSYDATDGHGFLRLSITDDGKTNSHRLFAQAIGTHSALVREESRSDVARLAVALDTTTRLASARDGRAWLDLSSENGSTLAILLPFTGFQNAPGV